MKLSPSAKEALIRPASKETKRMFLDVGRTLRRAGLKQVDVDYDGDMASIDANIDQEVVKAGDVVFSAGVVPAAYGVGSGAFTGAAIALFANRVIHVSRKGNVEAEEGTLYAIYGGGFDQVIAGWYEIQKVVRYACEAGGFRYSENNRD